MQRTHGVERRMLDDGGKSGEYGKYPGKRSTREKHHSFLIKLVNANLAPSSHNADWKLVSTHFDWSYPHGQSDSYSHWLRNAGILPIKTVDNPSICCRLLT